MHQSSKLEEKLHLTFSLYIFLSLPASSSIGWSIFWSKSHMPPLVSPLSSSSPIPEAIFQDNYDSRRCKPNTLTSNHPTFLINLNEHSIHFKELINFQSKFTKKSKLEMKQFTNTSHINFSWVRTARNPTPINKSHRKSRNQFRNLFSQFS